jgi:Uma2 family endonuclease
MSFAEFLAWEHEGGLVEWVEGKVIIHDMPKEYHQRMAGFLDQLLGLFVRVFHLGIVYIAPYPMRMKAGGSGREPDVLFVAAEHTHRITEDYLDGPADLVVEIISDDSVTRDRSRKFHEYQAGGVREYWVIDPRPGRQQADFYVLDEQGRYRPILPTPDGIYHSSVVAGFWLRLAWLWEETPDPLAALAEVVGTDRLVAALRAAPSADDGDTDHNHEEAR